jgi:hypothetical protein
MGNIQVAKSIGLVLRWLSACGNISKMSTAHEIEAAIHRCRYLITASMRLWTLSFSKMLFT